MKVSTPSVSELLERLARLEERTTQAEERAARAEAKAAQLESATGNLAAAAVDPRAISRRSLLTKAAAAGALGVAGALALNRPKDALAAFVWTGGAADAADHETVVTANVSFPDPAVLQLDANQGANPTLNIDGLRTFGTNGFSGIAAYGGNVSGAAYYGAGGPATGSTYTEAGPGVRVFAGSNLAGNLSFSYAGEFYGNGSSDGRPFGGGLYSVAAGYGDALVAYGGAGTTASPHVGGGDGVFAGSGPGAVGGEFFGDINSRNPLVGAHGVRGWGNGLGVGGWFYGGRALFALSLAGAAGPPTTNPHFVGDLWLDANKVFWICTANGTPGTFEPLQPGGFNNALYTAVSTQQYTLPNSDGATWLAMDSTNLKLAITPNYDCQAILTAGSDLWTFNAGFNQDIGIAVAGGVYPTAAGQPEAWKESGGFAGTFSPNAAAVHTVLPLNAGVAYTINLVWKASHGGSGTIAAGAGPIGGKFSPTRLTAQLIATKTNGAAVPARETYQAPTTTARPTPSRDAHNK